MHKTFIQSSQPAGPTAKTLRSPRIASSNHKEQKPYPLRRWPSQLRVQSENTRLSFEITRVANGNENPAATMASKREMPQKTTICQLENDDEIYEWIDAIYNRCPGMGGVSNPTNFSHRVHDVSSVATFVRNYAGCEQAERKKCSILPQRLLLLLMHTIFPAPLSPSGGPTYSSSYPSAIKSRSCQKSYLWAKS